MQSVGVFSSEKSQAAQKPPIFMRWFLTSMISGTTETLHSEASAHWHRKRKTWKPWNTCMKLRVKTSMISKKNNVLLDLRFSIVLETLVIRKPEGDLWKLLKDLWKKKLFTKITCECLGHIRDDMLPSYTWFIINHCGDRVINQPGFTGK